jgi:hypothetical protein
MKMERFNNLTDFYKAAWNLLDQAALSRNDPMRTPVMATVANDRPHQRTIVLRKVDTKQDLLYFFSDARAPKILHIKNNPTCNLVFYDVLRKVQIELQATGSVLQEEKQSRSFWEKIDAGGRSSYAAMYAPGSQIKNQQEYLPAHWNQDMDLEATEFAFENFAVLQLSALQLDVLHLHQDGHQRAIFTKNASKEWDKIWLVP